jgi:hypothetical protein
MEIVLARYLNHHTLLDETGAVPHSTKCCGAHTFPSDRSRLYSLRAT